MSGERNLKLFQSCFHQRSNIKGLVMQCLWKVSGSLAPIILDNEQCKPKFLQHITNIQWSFHCTVCLARALDTVTNWRSLFVITRLLVVKM